MVIQRKQSVAALILKGEEKERKKKKEDEKEGGLTVGGGGPAEPLSARGQSADVKDENELPSPPMMGPSARRACPPCEPCAALNLNDKMH